jgi:hypothetical protein
VGDNSGVVVLTSNPAASYGTYQGKKLGSTYSAVNVTDNMGCGTSGTGTITVVSCPTSLSVGTTYTPTLAKNPSYKTGVGLIATMNAGTGHDGAQISEVVTNGSNGCPFSSACKGGAAFTVGPPNLATLYNVTVPNVDNAFYDQHISVSASDVLAGTGVTSCSGTCNQTYYCNGTAIGKFTILFQYTHGQGVTNVNVTKTAN